MLRYFYLRSPIYMLRNAKMEKAARSFMIGALILILALSGCIERSPRGLMNESSNYSDQAPWFFWGSDDGAANHHEGDSTSNQREADTSGGSDGYGGFFDSGPDKDSSYGDFFGSSSGDSSGSGDGSSYGDFFDSGSDSGGDWGGDSDGDGGGDGGDGGDF
jgi:hypothetical protein